MRSYLAAIAVLVAWGIVLGLLASGVVYLVIR